MMFSDQSFVLDVLGLFVLFAGFILGLGAVTVIDIHGFLGRKSAYWTLATTRTHKVTKPLIWIGILLVMIGEALIFRNALFRGFHLLLFVISFVLIANGLFLSFSVSPFLLNRENKGKSADLLPAIWQRKIAVSLIFSDAGWWGSLCIIVFVLVQRMYSAGI